MSTTTEDILSIVVRKRTGVEFAGRAISFSSVNDRGPFDILPRHTNFVCLLQKFININTGEKGWVKMPIGRAVLRVRQNEIEVFLGI